MSFSQTGKHHTQLMKKYKLLVKDGELQGLEFPLFEGENLIGRWDPESGSFPDINLDKFEKGNRVSRLHARITVNDNHITIEDLDSKNGTFVNYSDNLLKVGYPCHLHEGDTLAIGGIIFKLVVV